MTTLLLPLADRVIKNLIRTMVYKGHSVVCNSFVTLALFQCSAVKNITTQIQWFRLWVVTNIVTQCPTPNN